MQFNLILKGTKRIVESYKNTDELTMIDDYEVELIMFQYWCDWMFWLFDDTSLLNDFVCLKILH